MATNDVDAGRLAIWKVVRLFDPNPHSEKPDAAAKALVGWLSLAPVLVAAALGAARDPPATWWMLLVGTVVTAVIFYGDTRMRTCADPALLVFAAHGVWRVKRSRTGARVDSGHGDDLANG